MSEKEPFIPSSEQKEVLARYESLVIKVQESVDTMIKEDSLDSLLYWLFLLTKCESEVQVARELGIPEIEILYSDLKHRNKEFKLNSLRVNVDNGTISNDEADILRKRRGL